MLTAEGCRRRIARLWDVLPEQVEWLLISDPKHVNYLSAFTVNPLSSSHGERAFLYIERDGESVLFCDNMTLSSSAADYFVDDVIAEQWYDHRHSVINRDRAVLKALKRIEKKLTRYTGLIEKEWFPLSTYETIWGDRPSSKIELPSLGSVIGKLRRKKETDEIELLMHCIRSGEAGQARAREIVRPGISEFEVFRSVQSAALESLGSPGLVYGDFRATTHSVPKQSGLPTNYVLKEGDTFILDFSVMLNGYRSDLTNTLAVGTPSQEQRELFQMCKAALRLGEEKLRPGALGRDIHRAVAAPFFETNNPELFPHHAGHGLGLGHPEPPIFVPESDDVLYKDDVVTLEPGAYKKGVGGVRIEHNYVITANGFERLSNHVLGLD